MTDALLLQPCSELQPEHNTPSQLPECSTDEGKHTDNTHTKQHHKQQAEEKCKTKREKQQRREAKRRDDKAARANSNYKYKPDTFTNLYRACICIPLFFVSLSLALTYSDYQNYVPTSWKIEDPTDAAIDHQTEDVFLPFNSGRRLDVLLSGFLPRITIYTSGGTQLYGTCFFRRKCATTGVNIHGLFFTLFAAGAVKYLPLPLPVNPSTSNVPSTIVTAVSGLLQPFYISQTHNSIELYVAERTAVKVSHWSVRSPPIGSDGTSAAIPTLTKIRDIGSGSVGSPMGPAITSDDNVLLVCGANTIYKVAPMLPHSATPTVTSLTFSNALNHPNKLTLHPAHNSATDFVLYVGNTNGGNILEYISTSATDTVLVTLSASLGLRPNAVTLRSNGSLIIAAQNGLKTSCCVDSFDYSTQLAGYQNAQCLIPRLVQYLHWDSVSAATEDPMDAVIDHQTQDLFVAYHRGQRVDVLLGGFLPKMAIYASASGLYGAVLIHRTCARTGVLAYGLFFTDDGGNIKYLPLPLPANPSTSNVGPTVATSASGLALPFWLTQTYHSIGLYVAEYSAGLVSHWAVNSPPLGINGTFAAIPTLTRIRSIGSVGAAASAAITSDDNVLLVSAYTQSAIYKATPMLPHSATPTITNLTFSNTLANPQKIILHPTHHSATDFILYVANHIASNVLAYNSTSENDALLFPTSPLPHAVTLHSNGTLIIATQTGLQTSCCVDSFNVCAAKRRTPTHSHTRSDTRSLAELRTFSRTLSNTRIIRRTTTETLALQNITNATAPPPTRKPKPPRAVKSVMTSVVSPKAAEAVQGVGTSSTVIVAGVIGTPTSPAQAARGGYMLAAVFCSLGELDPVSRWEHPLSFANLGIFRGKNEGASEDDDESETAAGYAEAALSTTVLLVLVPLIIVQLLWRIEAWWQVRVAEVESRRPTNQGGVLDIPMLDKHGRQKQKRRAVVEDADDDSTTTTTTDSSDSTTSTTSSSSVSDSDSSSSKSSDSSSSSSSSSSSDTDSDSSDSGSSSSSSSSSTTTTTTTTTSSSSSFLNASFSSSRSIGDVFSSRPGGAKAHLVIANVFEILSLIYFVPNVVNASVVVYSYSKSGAEIGVSAGCAALCLMFVAARFYWVHYKFSSFVKVKRVVQQSPDKSDKEIFVFESVDGTSDPLYVSRYTLYFDACRDPERSICRAFVFEEFLASVVMAVVGGFRSSNSGTCKAMSALILIVALLHLLYAVVIRPYRTKIDNGFLLIVALVQFAMSICVMALQAKEHTTGFVSEDKMMEALGYLTMALFASFFVQIVVIGIWAGVVANRRKAQQAQQAQAEEEEEEEAETASRRMLRVPVTAKREKQQRHTTRHGKHRKVNTLIGDGVV